MGAFESSKTLGVGGCSFASTDFAVRRLLWEAFADNKLKQLIVINPDTRVVDLVRELTHFERPITSCQNLREFI